MARLITIIIGLVLFTSCENVKGPVEVFEKIKLKRRSKSYYFSPGVYAGKVKISSSKKIKLTLGDSKKFTFRIPKGTSLPRYNGQLSLTARQVKQPYDLFANVESEETIGEERRGYEDCEYEAPVQRCSTDPQGRTRCWTEYRRVRGSRYVRYIPHRFDTDFQIDFKTASSENVVATFTGNKISVERKYIERGICR
jgi:hypothetical protein